MTEPTREIASRFVIHLFASGGVILLVYFILTLPRWIWVPEQSAQLVSLAALFVFAFSTLREAYDVKRGQSLKKAILDYASWALGCVVWGLILSHILN